MNQTEHAWAKAQKNSLSPFHPTKKQRILSKDMVLMPLQDLTLYWCLDCNITMCPSKTEPFGPKTSKFCSTLYIVLYKLFLHSSLYLDELTRILILLQIQLSWYLVKGSIFVYSKTHKNIQRIHWLGRDILVPKWLQVILAEAYKVSACIWLFY